MLLIAATDEPIFFTRLRRHLRLRILAFRIYQFTLLSLPIAAECPPTFLSARHTCRLRQYRRRARFTAATASSYLISAFEASGNAQPAPSQRRFRHISL